MYSLFLKNTAIYVQKYCFMIKLVVGGRPFIINDSHESENTETTWKVAFISLFISLEVTVSRRISGNLPKPSQVSNEIVNPSRVEYKAQRSRNKISCSNCVANFSKGQQTFLWTLSFFRSTEAIISLPCTIKLLALPAAKFMPGRPRIWSSCFHTSQWAGKWNHFNIFMLELFQNLHSN